MSILVNGYVDFDFQERDDCLILRVSS
eukprot:COSAG02_NODE_35352_length_469_cov_1.813514_1_plen_26_part_01